VQPLGRSANKAQFAQYYATDVRYITSHLTNYFIKLIKPLAYYWHKLWDRCLRSTNCHVVAVQSL